MCTTCQRHICCTAGKLSSNGDNAEKQVASLTGCWRMYVGLRSINEQEAGENCSEKPIMICTHRRNLDYWGDQIREGEMPRTCVTYRKERKCLQCVGEETVSKQTLWRIGCGWESDIKMEYCYVDSESVDWNHGPRNKGQDAVKTVMCLRIAWKVWISALVKKLLLAM